VSLLTLTIASVADTLAVVRWEWYTWCFWNRCAVLTFPFRCSLCAYIFRRLDKIGIDFSCTISNADRPTFNWTQLVLYGTSCCNGLYSVELNVVIERPWDHEIRLNRVWPECTIWYCQGGSNNRVFQRQLFGHQLVPQLRLNSDPTQPELRYELGFIFERILNALYVEFISVPTRYFVPTYPDHDSTYQLALCSCTTTGVPRDWADNLRDHQRGRVRSSKSCGWVRPQGLQKNKNSSPFLFTTKAICGPATVAHCLRFAQVFRVLCNICELRVLVNLFISNYLGHVMLGRGRVQRCWGYTYEQGESRRGEERRGVVRKQTDVPIQYLAMERQLER
jgi:hypothetical protein